MATPSKILMWSRSLSPVTRKSAFPSSAQARIWSSLGSRLIETCCMGCTISARARIPCSTSRRSVSVHSNRLTRTRWSSSMMLADMHRTKASSVWRSRICAGVPPNSSAGEEHWCPESHESLYRAVTLLSLGGSDLLHDAHHVFLGDAAILGLSPVLCCDLCSLLLLIGSQSLSNEFAHCPVFRLGERLGSFSLGVRVAGMGNITPV